MTNEMMRPCTLWGQTFDAMKTGTWICRPVPDLTQPTKTKTEYRIELFINGSDSIFSPATTNNKELERYKFEAITTIADALNAPVLATEEVLAGLPDEGTLDCTWEDLPKFEVQVSPNENYDEKEAMWVTPFYAFDEYPCEAGVTFGSTTLEGWFVYAPYYTEDGDWNLALQSVEGFKIRATNAETAGYLRQFTLKGVRRAEA